MSKQPKNKTYQVWADQVNRVTFTIKAKNLDEAKEKAHRVWRKEYANTITTIEEKEKE